MEKLLQELEELDTKENNLETLDSMLMVYLSSEEANDHQERVAVLALITKLRQLFL